MPTPTPTPAAGEPTGAPTSPPISGAPPISAAPPNREPASTETTSRTDDDLADILARLGEADAGPADDPVGQEPAAIAAPSTSGPTGKLTDPRDLTRPSSASGIVVDVGAGLEFDPSFASFGQRALGAIVDTVVVTLAAVPGLAILLVADGFAVSLLGIFVALLGLLAVAVLGARALATSGKWIGNRVAGTTVVDAINGSFIDQSRGVLRMLARHVVSPVLLFGYVIAFADTQRRTFHDRLAGTVVTRRPLEVWSADD